MKTITDFDLDGYGAFQTDFLTRLNSAFQANPSLQQEFRASIIEPLIAGIRDVGHSGTLTIVGASDRVDTPGLSREEIRRLERVASEDRAISAAQGIFLMLNDEFGGALGDSWQGLPDVAEVNLGKGAAFLVEDAPSLTEAQRRRNRRVIFHMVHFHP